jgi:hypothetical protein
VHLLAGPPAKKRKLNQMSNEDTMIINPEVGHQLAEENEALKARLSEAEAQLALMVNGSAQLPGMLNQFSI